ncbi:hypothetical protein [Mycobacterium sp. C31M]
MIVRINATDLRHAARQSAALRADARALGEDEPEVLLNIAVVIDRQAKTAHASAAGQESTGAAMRYVGTPRGLAGLIADVRRLGIADGVVLLTSAEHQVAGLMLDELAPGLRIPQSA